MFGASYLWILLMVFVSLLVPIRSSSSSTSTSTFKSYYKAPVAQDHNNYHNGSNNAQRRSRVTTISPSRTCDTEQIGKMLVENTRRLQGLDRQISDVQRTLEVFSSQLEKMAETNIFKPELTQRSGNEYLEMRVDGLSDKMQLVVTTLKSINSDVAWVKKNVSNIVTSTSDNTALPQQDQRYSLMPSDSFDRPKSYSSGSTKPRHCRDIQDAGDNVTGIYQIQPEYVEKPFLVFCDMETSGGGWTYIQNRFDGYQDFSLDWNDYKAGFGNIGGEFWLGLEHIYQLTGHELNELLIELVDFDNLKVYAHYIAFGIASEDEGYALRVLGGYSGNAGDSLRYHAGSRFSTKNRDQDRWVDGNCAIAHNGAWWYRSCDTSNLNGEYHDGDLPEDLIYQGMYWAGFRGNLYSLAKSRMMIRPSGGKKLDVFDATGQQ